VFEPLSRAIVAGDRSPDENLVRLYQELAANGIKMTLRDVNAKTENVIFHPMPGASRKSALCPHRNIFFVSLMEQHF